MSKEKHIHKLRKHKYKSGTETYFCALPDCSFKINPALSLGKRTICWRCGTDFLMNEYTVRLTKPHCSNCHRPKASKEDVHHEESVNSELVQQSENKELKLTLAERLSLELNNRNITPAEEDI